MHDHFLLGTAVAQMLLTLGWVDRGKVWNCYPYMYDNYQLDYQLSIIISSGMSWVKGNPQWICSPCWKITLKNSHITH